MFKVTSIRLITLLLLVFIHFSGHSQNTLDGVGLTATTPSSVAYSLRKLSSTYTGAAIQVRRSSDNATQNIGFDVNGNLDTAALTSWVGSGSGFIAIWYDQSGNVLNATQSNVANQPRIVNAGAIDRRNLYPTLVFSGGQFLVTSANYSNAAVFSTTAVAFVNTTNSGIFQIGAVNTLGSLFAEGSNWTARANGGGGGLTPFNFPMQLEQLSATYTGGTQTIFRRGIVGSNGNSSLNAATNTTINIGNLTSTYNLNGGVSELIIYNSLLSTTNRQTVETNQLNYYSMSTPITSTTTGGNWNSPTTWVGGVVPGPNNDVIIATTGTNNVTLNTAGVTLRNLTINSNARLVTGNNTISTIGSCVNNGTIFTANSAGILTSLGLTADRFLTTSGTIDYNGTVPQSISSITYGNLTISNTSAATTLDGTTTVGGNLTINTNAILNKASFGLTVNNTITNNGSLRSTGGRLTIQGGAAYNLAFAAGNNVLDTLVINRSGVTTLTAPLIINNLIQLTSGLITVPAGNLTLSNNAIATGGSNTAFINGQVIVNSNTTNSRTIPLGKNNILGSILLIPESSASSTYTLEYFNGAGVTPNNTSLGAGLAGVATNQFWSITKTGANASLVLNYNSSPGGTSTQQITLTNFNGSQWISIPSFSGSMANAVNGQAISQSAITGSYGNFGLGFINAIENGLDSIGLTAATPAAAAYGLRKLRSVYNGAALRIRRSNDNLETNIGFDANGHLDTAAIKTFTGVNDAFVTTWFDQSGNNRNFIQNTLANQPRIILAGVIDRKNGQPAIRHLAANAHNLNVNTAGFVTNNNPWSVSSVSGLDGGANQRVLNGSTNWLLGFHGGGERRAHFQSWMRYNGVDNYNNATATTNNQIYTAVSNGSSASVFNNGMQLAGTVPSGNTSIGTLSTGGGGELSNCVVQEVIIFSSALSTANRAAIERSQGLYYAIGNFAISTPTGGNWSNPATWENGVVPSTSSDVVINATAGAVVLDVNTNIRSINNAHLATLNLGAANTITTSLDVINQGTLITANPNGLIGSSASLNIGGTILNTAYNTSRVVYNGANQLVNPITYRNLNIINASGIKTILTGAATTISDTLFIDNGVTFNKSANDLNLACLTGTGLLSSTGGLLRFNTFNIANIGTLRMAPAPNNSVASFILSNSFTNASLTLATPLEVTIGATLDYGILNTDSVNILSLINSSASINRWSPASFINGPVQLISSSITQRQIAVGKNGTANRILITPQSTATTVYNIEYFKGNGSVPNTVSFDSIGLFKVYDNQYWRINRTSGVANIRAEFALNTAINGGVATETVTLANFVGGQWVSVPIDRSLSATAALPNAIATPVAISNTGLFAFASEKAIATAQSGAWNNPNTWAGGLVPSVFQSAFISPGHTVAVSSAAEALSITVAAGATLDFTTNQITGTTGGIINNGTIITSRNAGLIGSGASLPACNTTNTILNAGCMVIYNGGGAQTISALNYRKLTINNSASTKTLAGNTVVSDSLIISTLCTLNKGGFNLTLNNGIFGGGFLQSTGGLLSLGGSALRNTLQLNNFANTIININSTSSVTDVSAITHSGVTLNMQATGATDTVNLVTPLSVANISLSAGFIKTDSINILTLTGNGTHGSNASYINGPVQFNTSSTNNVVLGLGKQGTSSNVIITPTTSVATVWRADYYRSAPTAAPLASNLLGLGNNHYWTLSRNNTNNAIVSVGINQAAGGTSANTLKMAMFTNNTWGNIPITDNTILANTNIATITSASSVVLNSSAGAIDYFALGFGALPGALHTIASGNWTNPAIWSTNIVPSTGDSVTIRTGFSVSLDTTMIPGTGPSTVLIQTNATLNINSGVKYYNSGTNNSLVQNLITTGANPSVVLGLRRLSATYNGPAIQVRRGSDNALLDVFFTSAGNLNTSTLLSFAAGSSLFVVRWYDQSGNGRDFVQNTLGNQPRIVNNGVLEIKNNQPAIRHIAANNHFLFGGSLGLANNFFTVNVVSSNDGATSGRMLSSETNNWLLGFHPGIERSAHFNGGNYTVYNTPPTPANQIYTAVGQNTNNALIYRNGSLLPLLAVPSNRPFDLRTAGAYGQWADGTMQEIVIVPTALNDAQRSSIENSQQSYYLNGVSFITTNGIINNGTIGIADGNGLDSTIVGTAPVINTGSTLNYNGSSQNITTVVASNLVLSGSGTKTMVGDVSVTGNLTVNSGVTFNKSNRNLSFSGTTITNNGVMQSTGGNLLLSGSGNINIGFNDATNNVLGNLILNRGGSHTLTNPLTINTSIALNSGILNTTATNIINLGGAATTTGGSNTSHINGPLNLITNTLFQRTAPIGKNNLYAPVQIQPQTQTQTTYTVQYFNGAGVTPNTGNIGAGITGVATNQYWSITRNNSNNAIVGVGFNTSAGGTSAQQLVLANNISGTWQRNLVNNAVLGNATSGNIATQSFVSNFGNFTLGYTGALPENGLDSLGLSNTTSTSLALSLRRLRSAYQGPAIRVNRFRDSAELDIYFQDNGFLDTLTLKNFAAGATGENLVTFSEELNNAVYIRNGSSAYSIFPDVALSPIGTLTADSMNLGRTNGQWDVYRQINNLIVGRTYTLSMYVRLGTANNFNVVVNNTAAWNTIGGNSFNASNASLSNATWQRISYTFVGPATGRVNVHLGSHGGAQSGVTAQSNGSVYIWGFQLDEGSSASMYVATGPNSIRNAVNVKTWYDQSGNGRHAVQNNIFLQPTLTFNGVINYMNNKPSMLYDGVDDGFLINNIPTVTNNVNSLFWVQRATKNTYMNLFPNTSPSNGIINSGTRMLLANLGEGSTDVITGLTNNISSFLINGFQTGWGSSTTRNLVHQALQFNPSIVNSLNQPFNFNGNMVIANGHTGWNFGGDMPEIVVTTSTLDSARRVAVELSMGRYYGIVTKESDAWVSTDAGGNWSDINTWVQNSVPPAGAAIAIATKGNNSVVLDTTMTFSGITVRAGATLNLGNSRTTTLSGQLINNGTIITSHPNGLTGVSASVAGTVTHNIGSTIIYNGSSSQTVTPASYRKLRISGLNTIKTMAMGALTVNDTLTIDSGAWFVQSNSALTLNGNISGTGFLRPNSSNAISIGGVSGGSFGTIYFDTLTNMNTVGTLTVNRSGINPSVTFGNNLQANTAVNLNNGLLNTSNGALLILNNISTSGSGGSYINGPGRLINASTNTNRTIHVGKNGLLGAVTINPGATSSTSWDVQYFGSTPANIGNVSGTISSLSPIQYWSVTKNSSPTASPILAFNFNQAPGGLATSSLALVRYLTNWQLVPITANSLNGLSASGTLTTSGSVSFPVGVNGNDFAIGYPAPFETKKSGNWRDTSIWVTGAVPPLGSRVFIRSSHVVTVDTTIATAGTPTSISILRGGELVFNTTNTIGAVASGVTVAGTLTTAHAGGISSSLAGTITFSNGSRLRYNGAAQNVTAIDCDELVLEGSGTKTQTGAIVVNDTLLIGTGITFANLTQTLTLNGNYVSNGGGISSSNGNIIVGGSLGGHFGSLNISGTLASFTFRRYGSSPSLNVVNSFSVNNLVIENGIINTDTNNVITLTGSATLGSSSAHINGPIRVITTSVSPLILPIGKGGILGSINFTPSTASTTTWYAEYFNAAPGNTNVDTSISSISTSQYWLFSRIAGTANAAVTFNFNKSAGGNSSQAITLARFASSAWSLQNTSLNNLNGATVNGSLSLPTQSLFSYFCVGFFNEFVSVASGNWSSPSTWNTNSVPSSFARVTIKSGHVVNVLGTINPKGIIIESNAQLNLNSFQVIGQDVTVDLFGTIETARAGGLIGTGASIEQGTILLGSVAKVVYNGAVPQILSPLSYRKLVIANPAGVTVGNNLILGDSFIVSSGFLNLSTFNLSLSGGFNMASTAKGIRASGNNNIQISSSGNLMMDTTVRGVTNRLANLTITGSNLVTLLSFLEAKVEVSVSGANLNSNGFLTLISDSLGTARVAALVSPAQITGNVIVQRYIPAVTRRSRQLTSPVSGFTYNQLIDDIFVTGPNGGIGFDISTTNNASINTYNEQTSNGRGNKPVQNINDALLPGLGAFVFIRGDRTLPSPQWYTPPFVPQNAVTLDFVGPINQGTISPQITYSPTGTPTNDGWNMVGNPFPSPIDWSLVNKTGLTPFYYTLNPSTGSSVAANAGIIASGQGIFVQASSANPTITFSESSKVSGAPTNYFKTSTPPLLITMTRDALNSDVAMMNFNATNSRVFNNLEDAFKMTNAVVNLSLYAGTTPVQINGLPLLSISATDTFDIGVDASAGNYFLRFNNLSVIPTGLNSYLIDRMLNTTLPIIAGVDYPFSISSSPASFGKRFAIVFSPLNPLPIKLLSFNAAKSNDNVVLNWRTASELNMQSHILERKLSTDLTFKEVAIIKPNTGAVVATNYTYTDADILNNASGLICYRIKLVETNKSSLYSHVVCIDPAITTSAANILLLPNPAKEGDVVKLKIAGLQHDSYEIHVVDQLGRVIHKQLSTINDIDIDTKQFDSGIYNILLLSDGVLLGTSKLSIQ